MYYFAYGFFYLLSLLPLRALHIISDVLAGFNWYVLGYRKKIVLDNLRIAFPEKSDRERQKIARQFYKNFIDTFIETIKLLSVSNNWLLRHFTAEMYWFDELYKKGKNCQVHLGHNFNWEMANVRIPLTVPYQMLTVYMPIGSKIIDRLFYKIRSRTGAIMLPANKMKTAMRPYLGQQYMLTLVADQNPGRPAQAYWEKFFGRLTPFVTGPEKGARLNNTAVLFAWLTKRKRGYYHAHFELATESPNELGESELTKKYIAFLEGVIRETPEMWLWSHRRWKHEWKDEYA